MCPVWLLVAVVVVGVAKGAASQCWEHPSCQELNSESSVMVTFIIIILLWWFNAANIYVYIHHVVSLEATENVRLFFLSGSIITFACDALK